MLSETDYDEVRDAVSSLGFGNRRAKALITLATELTMMMHCDARMTGESVARLPGIGDYALASYLIFFERTIPTIVKDHALVKYIEWLASTGYIKEYRRI